MLKNNSVTPKSIMPRSVVKPLLQICYVFGLVPFSLDTYETSTFHYIYTGLNAMLIVGSIGWVIVFKPFTRIKQPFDSVLLLIVQYLIYFIHLVCSINAYIRCFTQKRNFISILKRLDGVIFHLETIGLKSQHDHRNVRVRVWMYSIVFVVNMIIGHANLPLTLPKKAFLEAGSMVAASFVANGTIFLIELQYIILFYIIYRKFLVINLVFEKNKAVAYRRQMVIIHNKLCDLCYDVHFVYDQQILILITSHFTYIICNIYFVAIVCIESMKLHINLKKNLLFIFITIYWCVFKSIHLVWVVFFADKTQNEGNKTHTFSQQKDSQRYGLMLAKQNIHLSVCGLFPLDFTLLYTVVGTATTYWIILIQLQFLLPQEITPDDLPSNSTET